MLAAERLAQASHAHPRPTQSRARVRDAACDGSDEFAFPFSQGPRCAPHKKMVGWCDSPSVATARCAGLAMTLGRRRGLVLVHRPAPAATGQRHSARRHTNRSDPPSDRSGRGPRRTFCPSFSAAASLGTSNLPCSSQALTYFSSGRCQERRCFVLCRYALATETSTARVTVASTLVPGCNPLTNAKFAGFVAVIISTLPSGRRNVTVCVF